MEVLFYHLQGQTLEQALPGLLEKTLQRGWKAVVKVSSAERMRALDDHLWTYSEEAFLPHGTSGEPQAAALPILLSMEDDRLNNAEVIFAVDGASLPSDTQWTRAVCMFDGRDEEALAQARAAWKDIKARGLEATYWQQDDGGRWAKKA